MSHIEEAGVTSYCDVCSEVLYPGRPHAGCIEAKRTAQINPSAEDIYKKHARETQEKFALSDQPPDAEMKAGLEIQANDCEIAVMMRSFRRLSAKPNKSAQNVASLNDMYQAMPDIIDKHYEQLKIRNEQYQHYHDQTCELVEQLKTKEQENARLIEDIGRMNDQCVAFRRGAAEQIKVKDKAMQKALSQIGDARKILEQALRGAQAGPPQIGNVD